MSILSLIKSCSDSVPPDGSWSDPRYFGAIIKREAPKYNLDPMIVAALVLWESKGGNASAALWEPGFFEEYINTRPPKDLGGHWPAYASESDWGDQVERLSRAISYGHGQIMGQVAREHGFSGDYMHELCDPEINIPLTCKILQQKWNLAESKHPGADDEIIERSALLLYNGGSNPTYPDNVLHLIDNGKAAEVLK